MRGRLRVCEAGQRAEGLERPLLATRGGALTLQRFQEGSAPVGAESRTIRATGSDQQEQGGDWLRRVVEGGRCVPRWSCSR